MILGPANVTLTDAGKAVMLNQAKVASATVGSLHLATADLIVSPIVPSGSTQFGDITLPAWGSYAAQAITWNAAAPQVTNYVQMAANSVEFALPAGAVGQTIYGWAISDSTPILIAVGVLVASMEVAFIDTAVAVPYIPWHSIPSAA